MLISRLTKFTEIHSTLTKNQLGTRSGRQIHNVIYCILSIIQCNISQKGLATYVTFCDFSTAFPSIRRGKLLSLLCKENIVGRKWKHLRERSFHIVKVRVDLHSWIPKSSSVVILRVVQSQTRQHKERYTCVQEHFRFALETKKTAKPGKTKDFKGE